MERYGSQDAAPPDSRSPQWKLISASSIAQVLKYPKRAQDGHARPARPRRLRHDDVRSLALPPYTLNERSTDLTRDMVTCPPLPTPASSLPLGRQVGTHMDLQAHGRRAQTYPCSYSSIRSRPSLDLG